MSSMYNWSNFMIFGLLGIVGLTLCRKFRYYSSQIPSFSSTLPGLSMLQCIFKTQAYLRDGYIKTKNNGGLFKLSSPNRWLIVATNQETIKDMYRASDQELSSYDAIDEILQFTHTLGPAILQNPYHFPLLTSLLAKRLDELCPAIFDEIEYVFTMSLNGHKTEKTSPITIRGATFIEDLVARASNRIFVGQPLCRNKRFIDLVASFTFKMTIAGFILSGTPSWLRGFVAFFISPNWCQRDVCRLLAPHITERRQQLKGDVIEAGSPDFLSSMMEIAEGKETSDMSLTLRILHVNFAAVSSTSTITCLVMNHIASRMDWQNQLYDEVQTIIDQEGYTFAALSRMVKVDSIVKEVMRFHHFSATTIGRIVKQRDFVFSNGISVPPGSLLCAASREVGLDHFGPDFDPFRFCPTTEDDIRLAIDGSTTSSPTFLAWGHGRHAWYVWRTPTKPNFVTRGAFFSPGRYFAVCQIKAIVAYTLFHYRISLIDQKVPKTSWLFVMSVPDKSLDYVLEPRK